MNINPEKVYCQLLYMDDLCIPVDDNIAKTRKKRKLYNFTREFYIEEYHNFEDFKKRMTYINNDSMNNCQKNGIDPFKYSGPFPTFIVFNKYQNEKYIGMGYYGWEVSFILPRYIIEYFENKYGKGKGKQKYLQLAGKELMFEMTRSSEPAYRMDFDLVSEETSDIILRNFLDKGLDEDDLDPEIFRQEVLKRNYI